MKKVETPLKDVWLVELDCIIDKRGEFVRWYCNQELEPILKGKTIVQANQSKTNMAGAIRGMHYQLPPHAETKLIRCIRGAVFDVVVDLRANSPTFLSWHSVELCDRDCKLLIVPEGCAHGFQVTEPEAEMLYLHTNHYNPKYEDGFRFDDPLISIKWPMEVTDISKRDFGHKAISKSFNGIKLP